MHSLMQKDFKDGMKSMNQRMDLHEERHSKLEKKVDKVDQKLDQVLKLLMEIRDGTQPSGVPEPIVTPFASPAHGLAQSPEFFKAKLDVLSYLATAQLPGMSDLLTLLKTPTTTTSQEQGPSTSHIDDTPTQDPSTSVPVPIHLTTEATTSAPQPPAPILDLDHDSDSKVHILDPLAEVVLPFAIMPHTSARTAQPIAAQPLSMEKPPLSVAVEVARAITTEYATPVALTFVDDEKKGEKGKEKVKTDGADDA